MSKIYTWSTTAASNNSASPNGWPEGMPPSGVNNSAREMMASIRDEWNDKEWFQLGTGTGTDTVTRASTTSVTIGADVTTTYHVGRRVKIYGANTGTIYGKIATSAYSSPNTTISFTLDSGTIHSSDTNPTLWVGSVYTNPSVPVIDTDAMTEDSAILPPSQQSVKAYVDSGTVTMTNKTLTSPVLTTPVLNTSLSGTAFLDEDDMSSDSATKVASQQSIKKFVEDKITAEDLDIITDSGNIDIDLDGDHLTLSGGTGINSSATGTTVTHAIDSTVATLTGSQTLTNKTLTSPVINTPTGDVATKTGSQTLTNKTINGSNNTLSNIANGSLSNSTVSYGGVSLSLGGTDATPAFDLTDATSYPTSSLTGTISNAQVATGVDAAKIADGTVSNTEFQYINSLSSNAQTQISARLVAASDLSDVASASTSRTNLGLGTIATQASNNVAVTGGSITGLGSPSASSDAATKNYVDEAVAGLRTRVIAECASTANVNISNALEAGDAIDGVTLVAGDRVLLKDQSTATENGLYLAVASGAASRDPEHDTIAELSGGLIVVNQGTVNDNKIFLCTTDSTGSIGVTNITYTQVTPSNTGTVTSIGLADAGASEFTVANSPITSSGTITLAVDSIAATKIGNGDVTDAELSYINSVTSNVQTQLDTKATQGFSIAMSVALQK